MKPNREEFTLQQDRTKVRDTDKRRQQIERIKRFEKNPNMTDEDIIKQTWKGTLPNPNAELVGPGNAPTAETAIRQAYDYHAEKVRNLLADIRSGRI